MPRMRTIGGSVLLLLWISAGAASQDFDRGKVLEHIKALPGNDPSARRAATEYLDSISLVRMSMVVSTASFSPPKVRTALEEYLPHPLWRSILVRGTIGEARRRERQIFGSTREKTLEGLARGAVKLLEGNAEDRALALRLLERAPAPDLSVLDPFLKENNGIYVRNALAAIGRADPERALQEAMRILEEGPDDEARQTSSIIGDFGSEALVPDLLRILAKRPEQVPTIALILARFGDERAEEALVPFIKTAGERDLYRICDTLSQIGGAASIAALRTLKKGLPEGDKKRAWCVRMLVRLRDPEIARELVAEGEWYRELHYLGDRTVVDALVKGVKERTLKLKGRKSALELIGLLGGREHLPFLLKHLNDGRYRDGVARGISALGDPKTARPLADALRSASLGDRYVKALLEVPLENVEPPIIEILDDPKGHSRVVGAAIWVARRAMTPELRKRLVALIANPESSFRWSTAAARAVGPRLGPEDRKILRPQLSGNRRYTRAACAMALALSGDSKGLETYVEILRESRLAPPSGTGNMLFALDPEPAELAAEVERVFEKHPTWFEGAEYLAHRKNPKGKDHLVSILDSKSRLHRDRALEALLALGHPPAIEAYVRRYETYRYEPDGEKLLAREAGEDALAKLRDLSWFQLSHLNATPARVLAHVRDESMIPYFRRSVRRDYLDNDARDQSFLPVASRALAAMGRKEMRNDFVRMLRSRSASKRALGIECLVTLGDRTSVRHLAPLLADVEEYDRSREGRGFRSAIYVLPKEPELVRIRDLATQAIEELTGQTFQGTARERADAAAAWTEKNPAEDE